MMRIIAAAAVFLLCGCAQPSATKTVVESVGQSVVALEQTLPAECKTDAVVAEINAIKAVAETLPAICEQEKETIREERDKWKLAFFAAAVILGLIITKRIA